ncbi:hypothetical protein SESBI_04878 [Sesbania bispinosa]|nr:hypothetical protein SESBI_04878 [Sesbania bispinosa]
MGRLKGPSAEEPAGGKRKNKKEPRWERKKSNNPTLQQIPERVDQLQQQNQTLQQQNQTLQQQSPSLQARMNTLTRGRAEEEDMETGLGEFHPFSPEIAEAQFPADFKEPKLKEYDDKRENKWWEDKPGSKRETFNSTGYMGRQGKAFGRNDGRGGRDEGGSSSRGNSGKRRREDGRRDDKEGSEEIRGVVTTIARGFSGGGEMSSARRKYVRSVMSSWTPEKISTIGDHNQQRTWSRYR